MLNRRTVLASALALTACAGEKPGGPGSPIIISPRLQAAPDLAPLPPAAPREFRAAWVATVANIDWPSKRGLSSAEQQAEMHALLDSAAALGLNAIIFQVRTAADALYDSKLEPWSEYLTGTQGQAPEPYYDPLALWISEAHRRGLELHAWFNPFRARHSGARSPLAATHLGHAHPAWIKRYGDQLWINPGEPDAAEHSIAVFKDVLQRYEVDGIHIDDYFYPYPVGEGKAEIDFPDEPSWQRYVNEGGKLARADWRRQNVSTVVERLHDTVRATKPWVRFGISPFGIGKPALRPPGIAGFSQYDKLYADAELWLAKGWVDYLVPQLYWPRAQAAQAFGLLLQYWQSQNPLGRHVWPGLFTSKVLPAGKPDSWPVDEIVGQILMQRDLAPEAGHAHFSMIALAQNRRGLADALKAGPYAEEALVPATPWLAEAGAALPQARVYLGAGESPDRLRVHVDGGEALQVAVWLRYGERWEFRNSGDLDVPAAGLDAIVASALDRVGREGPRSAWRIS